MRYFSFDHRRDITNFKFSRGNTYCSMNLSTSTPHNGQPSKIFSVSFEARITGLELHHLLMYCADSLFLFFFKDTHQSNEVSSKSTICIMQINQSCFAYAHEKILLKETANNMKDFRSQLPLWLS